ncbi:MAG: hypothetical protein ACOYVK_20900 [Bacillota bacterium]
MANDYSPEKDKRLNLELKRIQDKANKLILSNYFDYANISELQNRILQQIMNAKNHYDINSHLWNSGMIQHTLDNIAEKIKKIKKQEACKNSGKNKIMEKKIFIIRESRKLRERVDELRKNGEFDSIQHIEVTYEFLRIIGNEDILARKLGYPRYYYWIPLRINNNIDDFRIVMKRIKT